MARSALTDYQRFERSSTANRRSLRREELLIEISEALAEARASQGITAGRLAQRARLTQARVRLILAGNREPTLTELVHLADAMRRRVRIVLE